MSTIVNFNGKKIIEPGVYAAVKSGIPAAPTTASFGNVCIIDTGSGVGFGGGGGINGQFSNKLNSLYSFSDLEDFQNFVRGGLLYDVAPFIFNPSTNEPGPDQVMLIRAATTTAAEIEFTFTGGGTNGGFVKFLTKNEGVGSNGFMDEELSRSTLTVSGPIAIGNSIDDVIVFDTITSSNVNLISAPVVAVSTSIPAMVSLLNDAINSGTSTHGFTSQIIGGQIVVTNRIGTGSEGNNFAWISTSTTGTVAVSGSTFTGGLDGTHIYIGYSAKMTVGEVDPNKYMITFYEGAWRGQTPAGDNYSGLNKHESLPNLVGTSVEFDNVQQLVDWASSDWLFSQRFELAPGWQVVGDGSVDNADLFNYSEMNLATGGTTVYGSSDYDDVLKCVREIDNTFFLSDRYGDEARGTHNTKLLNHIINSAEYEKIMIVGGGIDETRFKGSANSSVEIAQYFDSDRVVVVHSGYKRINSSGIGNERMSAFYHAACVAGRLGGLEPQVPLTFKKLRIKDFLHQMTQQERVIALQAGVLHNRNVPGIGYVVNQGINSLQKNTQLINPDGSSFEISIKRIAGQLNKELILNLRPLFIGNNWGMASPADVKLFVERYLRSREVKDQQDNLIIRFENVTVKQIQDYYDIKYGFVPNGPVNKLFVTGFMLDPNLSA